MKLKRMNFSPFLGYAPLYKRLLSFIAFSFYLLVKSNSLVLTNNSESINFIGNTALVVVEDISTSDVHSLGEVEFVYDNKIIIPANSKNKFISKQILKKNTENKENKNSDFKPKFFKKSLCCYKLQQTFHFKFSSDKNKNISFFINFFSVNSFKNYLRRNNRILYHFNLNIQNIDVNLYFKNKYLNFGFRPPPINDIIS